jgi:ubiquinone/menaquinone biosynthesis C-methylase UbiE
MTEIKVREQKVREQYDHLSKIYDQRWSRYVADTLSFLKNWAQISPTDLVLDVACGTGEFERLILAEHPAQHMVGVDISEKMLAIARQKLRRYPSVSFQAASASVLPFPNSRFDLVISANAFHYFEDPDAALAEMKRVLKPNGKIIILDWCKDSLLFRSYDFWLKMTDPAHQQCYTQAEFHRLLNSAGFKIRHAAKVRFGFLWRLMAAAAVPQR